MRCPEDHLFLEPRTFGDRAALWLWLNCGPWACFRRVVWEGNMLHCDADFEWSADRPDILLMDPMFWDEKLHGSDLS